MPVSRHSPEIVLKTRLRDSELLAAIVENSDDAILTKDLDGIITSWNRAAERLFGYTADEIIGRSILTLIPADRQDEEHSIIGRIRRGEPIEHFETVRLRKDGSPIHLSISVSPLRAEDGEIIGASKIARDITERHRAEEMQRLLLAEMQHRIKNVFALAASLVSLSATRAATPAELATTARARLSALSRAQQLTVPTLDKDELRAPDSGLHALVRLLLEPALGEPDSSRLRITGPDLRLQSQVVTPLALVLNELATNAMKYGALRDESGRICVEVTDDGTTLTLLWAESHPDCAPPSGTTAGFGTTLSRIAVEQQLGGSIRRDWSSGGLRVTLALPRDRLV